MNFQSVESAIARRDYELTRPAQAVVADDDRALVLERLLMLTFVVVAAASVLWHLATGLEWVWTSCISQLHSAIVQAAIS